MGEFTITKWKCDRCGDIQDKRPPHCGEEYTVEIAVDYSTSGGSIVKWKSLCAGCNDYVSKLVKQISLGSAVHPSSAPRSQSYRLAPRRRQKDDPR